MYNEIISSFFEKHDIEIWGIADIKNNREKIVCNLDEDFDHAVVYGIPLSNSILDTIQKKPTSIYSFHYQRVNQLLDELGVMLSNKIERNGFKAFPVPASHVLSWNKLSAHVSHRHLAYYAGLGWWGKNNLLINEDYGAGVRYASVLTDFPIVPNRKISEKKCGDCRLCINNCPANAITKDGFNKVLCFEKTKEFSHLPGVKYEICGMCVNVCAEKFRKIRKNCFQRKK